MDNDIVETNEYRCLTYCKTCPFPSDGKNLFLEEGRVDNIKEELLKDDMSSFTCHKTVYNFKNKEELETVENKTIQSRKMCYGAYKYLQEQNRPNIMMRIAQLRGFENDKNR